MMSSSLCLVVTLAASLLFPASSGALVQKLPAPRPADLVLMNACETPRLVDDSDRTPLKVAVDWAVQDLRARREELVPFGERRVRRLDLLATLEDFRAMLEETLTAEELAAAVRGRFDVYRSPGQPGLGSVLYTAYNDPEFEGSLTPDARYRYPIYRAPQERGLGNTRFDRANVARGALAGKGLELAWLQSPIEAYLYELEGSGLVRLPDGRRLRVRYAASNGRPYQGLGSEVEAAGLLAPTEIARQQGRTFYIERPDLALHEMARNPRVIFFTGEVVASGVAPVLDLVAGRSVAVDPDYLPRAGLGFISLDLPEFAVRSSGPPRHQPMSRFAIHQDAGMAIRGPGRIDIYWGADETAQLAAGQLRQPGSMFLLLRKGTQLLAAPPRALRPATRMLPGPADYRGTAFIGATPPPNPRIEEHAALVRERPAARSGGRARSVEARAHRPRHRMSRSDRERW